MEMQERWSGTVLSVEDVGNGLLAVRYGPDRDETTTLPYTDHAGRGIAVGDEIVIHQDFRTGTATATVNGREYCRWTHTARRPQPPQIHQGDQ